MKKEKVALLLLCLANQVSGLVNLESPTLEDFKPHSPLSWETTVPVGEGWYFDKSIGYFYPVVGNPFAFENDWYYQLEAGWTLWAAGWSERKVIDGDGYISYLWPSYTLIYDSEKGWLTTHHSYFPWVFCHKEGKWEVITIHWMCRRSLRDLRTSVLRIKEKEVDSGYTSDRKIPQ